MCHTLITFIYKGLKETFGGDVCINYRQSTDFNVELDTDMQTPAAFQTFTVFYHFQYLDRHHSDEKAGFFPPVSPRRFSI